MKQITFVDYLKKSLVFCLFISPSIGFAGDKETCLNERIPVSVRSQISYCYCSSELKECLNEQKNEICGAVDCAESTDPVRCQASWDACVSKNSRRIEAICRSSSSTVKCNYFAP